MTYNSASNLRYGIFYRWLRSRLCDSPIPKLPVFSECHKHPYPYLYTSMQQKTERNPTCLTASALWRLRLKTLHLAASPRYFNQKVTCTYMYRVRRTTNGGNADSRKVYSEHSIDFVTKPAKRLQDNRGARRWQDSGSTTTRRWRSRRRASNSPSFSKEEVIDTTQTLTLIIGRQGMQWSIRSMLYIYICKEPYQHDLINA
jgi:hypothetical protein